MRKGRWPGTWLTICDRCGFQFPSDNLKKDWQGLMVCDKDFETRHPQDFLRSRPDREAPPWVRPEAADVFIAVCDLWSSSPLADFGDADCAVVGGNVNISLLIDIFNPIAIAEIAIAGRSIPGVIS